MYTPGFLNLGATEVRGWRILCHGGLSWAPQKVEKYPGSYPPEANSIISLSSENQKSPDIVKCLLVVGRGVQIHPVETCCPWEDRPHLQTPIILNSLPHILFFILVQLLLAHKSLFGNKTKQNRKPVHHKIISRIGLQSRAFVLVLLEKNLHMNNILKEELTQYTIILCPQPDLQISA